MWGGTRGREAPSIATQSLFIVVSQSEHLGEERPPDARPPLLLHQLTRHPPPTPCQPGQSGGGKWRSGEEWDSADEARCPGTPRCPNTFLALFCFSSSSHL